MMFCVVCGVELSILVVAAGTEIVTTLTEMNDTTVEDLVEISDDEIGTMS